LRGVELSFQSVPPEVFFALAAATVAIAGWKAFHRPGWGLLAVLFALPLQKTAGDAGFLARFTIVDVFTAIAAAGTAVAIARGRAGSWRDLRVPKQFVIGIGLFLPIVLASFFVTETPSRSAVETIAYLVNVVIVALVVFHVRTRRQLWACLDAWEWAAALVVVLAFAGIVCLFLGQLGTLLTEGPKVTGPFKKSGQLSSYIVATLPVLWFNLMYRTHGRRALWLRRLLLAGAVAAVVATGSRTGFVLGAAVGGALFGGRWIVAFLRRRTGLKLAGVGFAGIVLVWACGLLLEKLPYSFHRAVSVLYLSGDDEESLESLSPTRHYQMVGFQTAATEYPWTGVGVGDFYTRNTALAPGTWHSHEIHNTYLGVWAETGILGIAALVVFYVAIVQALWQAIGRARIPEDAALGVALLVATVAFWMYGTSHFTLRMRSMWAVFALALALWNVVRRERGFAPPAGAAA
jgi:O-antigen ligase